ncbi:MAG: hypothetical protein ACE5HI_05370 [bacterium]
MMYLVEKAKSDFSFSKWYLDCIDATGNVFIGYSAILKWKKLSLNYANILLYSNSNGLQTDTTFKKLPSPKFHQQCLQWQPSQLKTHGTWKSIDPSIKKTLFKSGSGTIDWLCYQPKAKADVLSKNQQIHAGFGYTEKLAMTIKPWEFPITELRWGRFLSETDTIIWVNWKGFESLNLLFYQGKQIEDTMISDEHIIFNQGEFILLFSDTIALRRGPLISSVFSKTPSIKSVFPDNILYMQEYKWRSRGTLRYKNKKISNGWVIHEVVQWK